MARPRSKIAQSESVKLDAETLETVRELAAEWHLSLEAALALLVRTGSTELAFPLLPGERTVVHVSTLCAASTCAPFQLRQGLSLADLNALKGSKS